MNTTQAKALIVEHKDQIAYLRALALQTAELARERLGHKAAISILERYIRALEERNFLADAALRCAIKDAREYIEDFEDMSKHSTSCAKSIEVVRTLIAKLEAE